MATWELGQKGMLEMGTSMDYYDILMIGSVGIGKSTTTDKLLVANPTNYDYKNESAPLSGGDVDAKDQWLDYCDIKVWLALGNGFKIDTYLKFLNYCRKSPSPHLEINKVWHVSSGQPSAVFEDPRHNGARLLSNETSKLRILDVPGFFDDTFLDYSLNKINLDIMRSIIRIQVSLAMKFKRVLYFLPCRGPLERINAVLKLELKWMAHFFDSSIFKSMIIVATVPSTISEMDIPNDKKFSPQDAELTKKIFKRALKEIFSVSRMSDESLPDPPLIFISQIHTCEEILEKIQNASVAEEELTLETNKMSCCNCGMKVGEIRGQRVVCYFGEELMDSIPYMESTCHPEIISKYTRAEKIFGGIKQVIVGGELPNFDAEKCIVCGQSPSTRGCMLVGREYRKKGTVVRIDHVYDEHSTIDYTGDHALHVDHSTTIDEHRAIKHSMPMESGIPMAIDFRTKAMKRANVSFVDHSVLECDYSGIEYTNKKHNFSLQIPEGAIPMGEKVCFEIAIAMQGPFILPKNTRLISPILWLCPCEENMTFNKPFQVVIPHILHKITEEKAKEYQLGFAKANHRNISHNNTGDAEYNFQPLISSECDAVFSSTSELSFGTATMNHFCYLCITAKNTPELKSDIGYCLTRAQRPATARRHEVCFCVSYCLGTCIEVGY
jgi:hypothetical protein